MSGRGPGDGKIDMGDGRRLYPCEARAEMEAKQPPMLDADGKPALHRWPWQSMWPQPITKHYHADETP